MPASLLGKTIPPPSGSVASWLVAFKSDRVETLIWADVISVLLHNLEELLAWIRYVSNNSWTYRADQRRSIKDEASGNPQGALPLPGKLSGQPDRRHTG
jgi:hypothetical protein